MHYAPFRNGRAVERLIFTIAIPARSPAAAAAAARLGARHGRRFHAFRAYGAMLLIRLDARN